MQTTITVHGFHLDGYGHVNNARFLEFLEAARWDQLNAQQETDWWHDRGYAFVIVNININFRQPASLGDRLRVGVTLAEIGETSARLRQTVCYDDSDELVADADLVFVILDTTTGTSAPLTGELRARLEALGENLTATNSPRT